MQRAQQRHRGGRHQDQRQGGNELGVRRQMDQLAGCGPAKETDRERDDEVDEPEDVEPDRPANPVAVAQAARHPGRGQADRDVAETWEISDHGEEQSTVVNGPLAGKTLRALMEKYKAELVGDEVWERYGDYFPLLVKFLDCDKRLPAHMHPNDAHAERLGLADRGKTEAWYIVKADPGAGAYCGTLPCLTPDDFRAAIKRAAGRKA